MGDISVNGGCLAVNGGYYINGECIEKLSCDQIHFLWKTVRNKAYFYIHSLYSGYFSLNPSYFIHFSMCIDDVLHSSDKFLYNYYMYCVPQTSVSVKRLQKFLINEELDLDSVHHTQVLGKWENHTEVSYLSIIDKRFILKYHTSSDKVVIDSFPWPPNTSPST